MLNDITSLISKNKALSILLGFFKSWLRLYFISSLRLLFPSRK
jgi:hypothetical protein